MAENTEFRDAIARSMNDYLHARTIGTTSSAPFISTTARAIETAILAMPQMQAIRRALRWLASDNAGTNLDRRVYLAFVHELSDDVIAWVLDGDQ